MSALLAIAYLSLSALAPEPAGDRCTWIQLTDDPSVSIEDQVYAGGSVEVARALARVIDRLESRACLERSAELLVLFDQRLAELEDSGHDVARLRARVELVAIRIELRQVCGEVSCEETVRECPALERLRSFVEAHPEIEPGEVEEWLLAEQSKSRRERLSCQLEAAREPAPVVEQTDDDEPPKPVLLEPGPLPSSRVDSRWTPQLRATAIGVSSVGIAAGVAAMIAGGVMLSLDEKCPGGGPPDSCELRYSTSEEGALALGLGGAALIGSSIGLTFAVIRKPATSGATGWTFGLGYSGRF